MGDYNIHQWLEKIFNDWEAENLMLRYNALTGSNITLALLPFLSHEALTAALHRHQTDMRLNNQTPSEDPSVLDDYLRKLDPDEYWVDMTTIGDRWRIEYNTVTEERRELENDRLAIHAEIFGNVRKTL